VFFPARSLVLLARMGVCVRVGGGVLVCHVHRLTLSYATLDRELPGRSDKLDFPVNVMRVFG
jgi:hypothetical protein